MNPIDLIVTVCAVLLVLTVWLANVMRTPPYNTWRLTGEEIDAVLK